MCLFKLLVAVLAVCLNLSVMGDERSLENRFAGSGVLVDLTHPGYSSFNGRYDFYLSPLAADEIIVEHSTGRIVTKGEYYANLDSRVEDGVRVSDVPYARTGAGDDHFLSYNHTFGQPPITINHDSGNVIHYTSDMFPIELDPYSGPGGQYFYRDADGKVVYVGSSGVTGGTRTPYTVKVNGVRMVIDPIAGVAYDDSSYYVTRGTHPGHYLASGAYDYKNTTKYLIPCTGGRRPYIGAKANGHDESLIVKHTVKSHRFIIRHKRCQ